MKFKNGLRPELKQGIAILEMNDYGRLVQKTKEYEEAYNERVSAFRNSKPRPDANNKGKNMLTPRGQDFKRGGHQRFFNAPGKTYGRGSGSYNQIRCGKCGKDHYTRECKETDIICFRCNKPGHMVVTVKVSSQNRATTSSLKSTR